MTWCEVNHPNSSINRPSILLLGLAATGLLGQPLSSAELPPELPLWESESPEHPIQLEAEEAVRADGWEAIRVLRSRAEDLGLRSDKIGICGFSAGGHLAISCALYPETKPTELDVSGLPDFAGQIYPGIPEGIDKLIEARATGGATSEGICPMFLVNARVDRLTPVDKCLEFYTRLLQVGVHAELHVFAKGSHGFDLGTGRGESLALWPMSFIAWLRDCGMVENPEHQDDTRIDEPKE